MPSKSKRKAAAPATLIAINNSATTATGTVATDGKDPANTTAAAESVSATPNRNKKLRTVTSAAAANASEETYRLAAAAAPSPGFGSTDAKSSAATAATPLSFLASPLPASGATPLNAAGMFSPPNDQALLNAQLAAAIATAALTAAAAPTAALGTPVLINTADILSAARPIKSPVPDADSSDAAVVNSQTLIDQHNDLVTELNEIYLATEQKDEDGLQRREQLYAELDANERAHLSVRIALIEQEINYENGVTAEIKVEEANENIAAAAANATTGNDPLYFAGARSLSEENRLLQVSGAAALVSATYTRQSATAIKAKIGQGNASQLAPKSKPSASAGAATYADIKLQALATKYNTAIQTYSDSLKYCNGVIKEFNSQCKGVFSQLNKIKPMSFKTLEQLNNDPSKIAAVMDIAGKESKALSERATSIELINAHNFLAKRFNQCAVKFNKKIPDDEREEGMVDAKPIAFLNIDTKLEPKAINAKIENIQSEIKFMQDSIKAFKEDEQSDNDDTPVVANAGTTAAADPNILPSSTTASSTSSSGSHRKRYASDGKPETVVVPAGSSAPFFARGPSAASTAATAAAPVPAHGIANAATIGAGATAAALNVGGGAAPAIAPTYPRYG